MGCRIQSTEKATCEGNPARSVQEEVNRPRAAPSRRIGLPSAPVPDSETGMSPMLRRPRLLAALALASLAPFAGCGSEAPKVVVAPAQPSGPYMRLQSTGVDEYSSELAMRTFRRPDGKGPAVIFVPAIHIGSKAYYQNLQRILDAQKLVLFEGVSEHPDDFKKIIPKEKADKHLYGAMAKALGLITQFEGIDYRREHFTNADLSMSAMRNKLEEETKLPGKPGADARLAIENLKMLEGMISGEGFLSFLVKGMIGFIEADPRLRAQVLLTLASAEIDAGNTGFPGAERLVRLVLDDRNAEAIRKLNAVLSSENPPETIAIFYGAAHLHGMEELLQRDSDYRLADTLWLRTFSVHPKAAGMTDADIDYYLRRARRTSKKKPVATKNAVTTPAETK